MTTKLAELYINFGGGAPPLFIAEDLRVSITKGVRMPTFMSVVNRRPAPGTRVYVYFPQESGRTYMWRTGFYTATVL